MPMMHNCHTTTPMWKFAMDPSRPSRPNKIPSAMKTISRILAQLASFQRPIPTSRHKPTPIRKNTPANAPMPAISAMGPAPPPDDLLIEARNAPPTKIASAPSR